VRTLISTLVATAVALHSVLGCCWHHAHAWESDGHEHVCGEDHGIGTDWVAACSEEEHSDHDHGDCPHAAARGDELIARSDLHRSAIDLANIAHEEPSGHESHSAPYGGEEPCRDECPGPCDGQYGPVSVRVQIAFSSPASLPPALVSAAPPATGLGLTAAVREFDAGAYPPHERPHLLRRLLLI
jgi:hypothetical protein